MSFRPFQPFQGFGGGVALSFDAAAADYFARIAIAGSTISATNKTAVNAFVVGCKADGIWSAIKASCILAAADTLAGALVPLVGTAPTNINFVAGDYSRLVGLKGDAAANKVLNSNVLASSTPQNSFHVSVFASETGPASPQHSLIGAANNEFGIATKYYLRNRAGTVFAEAPTVGFAGFSRAISTHFDWRNAGVQQTFAQASAAGTASSICVFARGVAGGLPSSSRQSFYSIGEAINLAQLDARLTTLMASLT